MHVLHPCADANLNPLGDYAFLYTSFPVIVLNLFVFSLFTDKCNDKSLVLILRYYVMNFLSRDFDKLKILYISREKFDLWFAYAVTRSLGTCRLRFSGAYQHCIII